MNNIVPRISSPMVRLLNSWGDALLVISDTPIPLAEAALRLRDEVRNTDWHKLGFPQDIVIRIGLHLQKVRALYREDGSIENIIGVGVDTTARIEPVTEPNTVYCSQRFYDFLQDEEGLGNIRGSALGKRKLAKNFGEMELYQLVWKHEHEIPPKTISSSIEKPSIPLPAVRQRFGDKQLTEFLYKSFEEIHDYFTQALEALKSSNSSIEISLKHPSETQFVCEIHHPDHRTQRCRIWIENRLHSAVEEICFYQGNSDIYNNAVNDTARVENDGRILFLKSTFGGFSNKEFDSSRNPSTSKQIAENWWIRFSNFLENRTYFLR